jgi:hypothetical protein
MTSEKPMSEWTFEELAAGATAGRQRGDLALVEKINEEVRRRPPQRITGEVRIGRG